MLMTRRDPYERVGQLEMDTRFIPLGSSLFARGACDILGHGDTSNVETGWVGSYATRFIFALRETSSE
ncbi:MAG: hypothetical protein NPIRA04_12090 [Nitrospirales bacterium]|nr:MAG: hypothetical protein NPIRA04_12090 [Nitrospirales bacterium]